MEEKKKRKKRKNRKRKGPKHPFTIADRLSESMVKALEVLADAVTKRKNDTQATD